MIKKILTSSLMLLSFTASAEVTTLNWIDLVPEDERQFAPMEVIDHSGAAAKQSVEGNIREELNGTEVKMPGFVIPLEGDNDHIREFLLVPHFGACVHVPPPPPNQIIYVKMKTDVPPPKMWDIVYVTGDLLTQKVDHELAQAAYVLEGYSIEEYKD